MKSHKKAPLLAFSSPLLLAPMAGVNDPVFRAICRRMGAGLTYTEMISAKGLAYNNARTQEMIAGLPEDRPYAVQLFGYEPEVLAEQAHALEEQLGSDLALIDLNMGCPARKVTSGGSGAALLLEPELSARIVAEVSAAISVPVTIKMRLVSTQSEDTLAFAEKMVKAGAAAIAVHGRTAEQFYTGTADRAIVEQLTSALEVPIIASGDVFTKADAQEYLERGARAVMIARGARGRPWIFAEDEPDLTGIIAIAREHTTRLYNWEPRKHVWMRKHLAWYFKGTPIATSIRKAVQSAVSLEDYLTILDNCEAG